MTQFYFLLFLLLFAQPFNFYQFPYRRNKQNNLQPQTEEKLKEIYSWSQFDFKFPDNTSRQEAIRTGMFIPLNSSAPASIEVSGNRLFITLPRWKNGVPATLNTVNFPSNLRSPLLNPYPNWNMNRIGTDCKNTLTSVYRVKVDKCNWLWVLDTGTINSFKNAQNICPVQVFVFDLSTDKLIYRYRVPDNVLRPDSQPVTIEVEYPNEKCGSPTNAVVYIADTVGFALIIANMSTQEAWQVRDKTMFPSPEAGTFNIAGETFELMDGVLGLALSPENTRPSRILYYNAMNSFNQRWVPTDILRNRSLATTSPTAFMTEPYTRSSQSGYSAIDQHGIMFFGLLGEQAVACWNTNKAFNRDNIVILARNDATLQFPVSVVVDKEDRLWVIATKFQSFFLGTQSMNAINYRVFMAPSTSQFVKGTACEK